MKFGLSEGAISRICAVFALHSQVDSVVLYGSRAKGSHRSGSDVDLTMKGEALSLSLQNRIANELDDLLLPYSFDLSAYDDIENSDLISHIERVGNEFYNREKYASNQQRLVKRKQGPQYEQTLEKRLVEQLTTQGYAFVAMPDEAALLANLKTQLGKHNQIALSEAEFQQVLRHLDKGGVFERAKVLRDKMHLRRDNGESFYLEFMNQTEWCQNQYQVSRQVTIGGSVAGSYKNRYDVTLLVNGLPLVQIELKRCGIELKEAFNQINRYQRHPFWVNTGLFQYVQLFVMSNGVNSKYFANNSRNSFKQTFYWSDENNQRITPLDKFAMHFLEKCKLSRMISRYMVLNETDKTLMVLRPYQFFAVEKIVEKVRSGGGNGYIWHTTGSGKTLTSFKASQIITQLPQVHKVIFVVDRKDLDYQTSKEFNAVSTGCVDGTDNTRKLVAQLKDSDIKLIVTTIQKLNTVISKSYYQEAMGPLRHKRIVFIFDECHRSHFGDTHKRIVSYFNNHQMFGFTGTPIIDDNVTKNRHGKRTTKDLFNECLHRYAITDAIRDENVLKFSVEYVGRYKRRDDSANEVDIEVGCIDRKELMESPRRQEQIVDYILAHHNRKTHAREFTAMFCTSGVNVLTSYYDLFKAKREAGLHNLNIATIFSYIANEEDKDADGLVDSDPMHCMDDSGVVVNQHSRDKLESCIADYNTMFGTAYSTRGSDAFFNYYKDIAKRVREKQVDILLVVNMFLTGFDSKPLNTLYVDKSLNFHGLIQAYSRTNRILSEKKSQGNIVCFRNLKKATDDAIALFSNVQAKEVIIMAPYEQYVREFNKAVGLLLAIAPTMERVDQLVTEEDELAFIKAFRNLLRTHNILITFADFSFADLIMNEQAFADYRSKYLDLYDKVRSNRQKEVVSILDDVDFELELIHRDENNVTYILQLLARLKDKADEDERKKQQKVIIELVEGDSRLRSKRELIEKFLLKNMPEISNATTVPCEFNRFWRVEKQAALDKLCGQEKLLPEKVERLIASYLSTEITPLRDNVVQAMREQPRLLQRKKLAQRALNKILRYIEVFITNAPAEE
ncbi:MAG: HsdR family type I site-specific deoxyribonuclease [Sedimenticola sp.]